jgi:GT2 family glycosyltransferase
MTRFLIQCVVVLYKQRPRESNALSALLDICNSDPSIASQIAILVQDNSPLAQEFVLDVPEIGHSVCLEYHHTLGNPGLAYAYNNALDLANKHNIPWLLLLDQDTCLTRQFLIRLLEAIRTNTHSQMCCAFVPQLVREGLVLSPQVVGKIFYRRLRRGCSGLATQPLVAFNSAACIRVHDLTAIGGFPKEFWLDYLDHMVFYSLQQAGGRVFVLDSQLEHSLSLTNIESEVSNERYENVLRAEWMFVRKTGWGGGSVAHRFRLLKRAFSHSVKLRNKSYALQTLRSAFS